MSKTPIELLHRMSIEKNIKRFYALSMKSFCGGFNQYLHKISSSSNNKACG